MNLADEIAALARRTVPELRERYAALFGEGTTAKHKTWLVKRIAWRLQAVAEGELSERARQRALQLANDADLRRFQYRIVPGLVPVESHLGTIDVIEHGPESIVVYSTEVSPDSFGSTMQATIAAATRVFAGLNKRSAA